MLLLAGGCFGAAPPAHPAAPLKSLARDYLELHSAVAEHRLRLISAAHPLTQRAALASFVLGIGEAAAQQIVQARADLQLAATWPAIADAANYTAGRMLLDGGDAQSAFAALAGFGQRFPTSPYASDAGAAAAEAASQLQKWQDVLNELPRSDAPHLLWLRAQALQNLGRGVEAIGLYRRIFFDSPTAADAAAAGQQLQQLAQGAPADSQHCAHRGEALLAAGRAADAAAAFGQAVALGSEAQRPALQLRQARASWHTHDLKTAGDLLRSSGLADSSPEAIELQVEIARSTQDLGTIEQLLSRLAELAPASTWYERALLEAANEAVLRNDLPLAQARYDVYVRQFPTARFAHIADLRASWISYFLQQPDAASRLEQYVEHYPQSESAVNALYWRGQLAKRERQTQLAAACFRAAAQYFPETFFGQLSRDENRRSRLRPAFLRALESPVAPRAAAVRGSAAVLARRARLFESAWLLDPAATMWRAAYESAHAQAATPAHSAAASRRTLKGRHGARSTQRMGARVKPPRISPTLTISRQWADLEGERQNYDGGIGVMERELPELYRYPLPALSRADWGRLFPFPYRDQIIQAARRQRVDPYLVLGLIRQESGFDPHSISHARAIGLMQLLVGTANLHRRAEGLPPITADDLQVPATNIDLGVAELRSELKQYAGHAELALAAYNAGDSRVRAWQQQNTAVHPEEFIESIPFGETRMYVQLVLRNARVYRDLYGRVPSRPAPRKRARAILAGQR